MLIGFYPELDAESAAGDRERLRAAGCDRVFASARTPFVTDEVIEFLRDGDVLVVTDLSRLAGTVQDVIFLADRLHKAGVAVHAIQNGLGPGTEAGDAFGSVCSILAELYRPETAGGPRKARKGQRGRPIALRQEDQMRAERLLQRASVLEVARLLKVSPATIYRYFPRRRLPSVSRSKNDRPPAPKGGQEL